MSSTERRPVEASGGERRAVVSGRTKAIGTVVSVPVTPLALRRGLSLVSARRLHGCTGPLELSVPGPPRPVSARGRGSPLELGCAAAEPGPA